MVSLLVLRVLISLVVLVGRVQATTNGTTTFNEVLTDDEGYHPAASHPPEKLHLNAKFLATPGNVWNDFQMDLLESLKRFALEEDHIELVVNLTELPKPNFDDALNLLVSGEQDLLVGTYYTTPDRFAKVDFTPVWKRGGITTMKSAGKAKELLGGRDITTMDQATQHGATICIPEGTFLARNMRKLYPTANYYECTPPNGFQDCFDALMDGRCLLLAGDEITSKAKLLHDPSFQMTGETLSLQFTAWPIRRSLDPHISYLLKRWMYMAQTTGTLKELMRRYFEIQKCPLGTAGDQCQLPCNPDHGTADARGVCVCDSVKWTGEDCSEEIVEDLNRIPISLKVIGYAMFGINVCIIVGCAIWLYLHQKTPQVRASQPSFLLLVLLGCLISSSTILLMAQEDSDQHNDSYETSSSSSAVMTEEFGFELPDHSSYEPPCMGIPWLYSIGFCVTFGTLFAKIRRVYIFFKTACALPTASNPAAPPKLSGTSSSSTSQLQNVAIPIILSQQLQNNNFNASAMTQSQKVRNSAVSFQEAILVIAAILMVDMIILITWSTVDPLQWERVVTQETQFGEPLESEGYCVSDYWIVFATIIGTFHLALMATACYCSYSARHIPTLYQEGKYVSIALISNLQIFLVGVPILVIIGTDPQTSFFVRSMIVWMNDLVVVGLIFGNLIYSTYKSSSSDSVKEEVGKAVSKFSNNGKRNASVNSKLAAAGTIPPVPAPSNRCCYCNCEDGGSASNSNTNGNIMQAEGVAAEETEEDRLKGMLEEIQGKVASALLGLQSRPAGGGTGTATATVAAGSRAPTEGRGMPMSAPPPPATTTSTPLIFMGTRREMVSSLTSIDSNPEVNLNAGVSGRAGKRDLLSSLTMGSSGGEGKSSNSIKSASSKKSVTFNLQENEEMVPLNLDGAAAGGGAGGIIPGAPALIRHQSRDDSEARFGSESGHGPPKLPKRPPPSGVDESSNNEDDDDEEFANDSDRLSSSSNNSNNIPFQDQASKKPARALSDIESEEEEEEEDTVEDDDDHHPKKPALPPRGVVLRMDEQSMSSSGHTPRRLAELVVQGSPKPPPRLASQEFEYEPTEREEEEDDHDFP